jgi:hypothetical protein
MQMHPGFVFLTKLYVISISSSPQNLCKQPFELLHCIQLFGFT